MKQIPIYLINFCLKRQANASTNFFKKLKHIIIRNILVFKIYNEI